MAEKITNLWVQRIADAYEAFDEMECRREQRAALYWLTSRLEQEWKELRKPEEAPTAPEETE